MSKKKEYKVTCTNSNGSLEELLRIKKEIAEILKFELQNPV